MNQRFRLNQSFISLAKAVPQMRRTPPSYCGDLKSAELSFFRNYIQEFIGIHRPYLILFCYNKWGASMKSPESGDKF